MFVEPFKRLRFEGGVATVLDTSREICHAARFYEVLCMKHYHARLRQLERERSWDEGGSSKVVQKPKDRGWYVEEARIFGPEQNACAKLTGTRRFLLKLWEIVHAHAVQQKYRTTIEKIMPQTKR